MKYIKIFEKYLDNLSQYKYVEYIVSNPGKITSHNYYDEIKMHTPFYLADGYTSNYDYGKDHQLFLIIPGTKIVQVESSDEIKKIDLANLEISEWSFLKIKNLLLNRLRTKTESFSNIRVYSELIKFLENILKYDYYDYVERMIQQIATIDYLREVKKLDFEILEFTQEGSIAPNQYLVLDIDSIIAIEDDEE